LNEEMWVKCEICGKGFDNYPALIAHIYKHYSEFTKTAISELRRVEAWLEELSGRLHRKGMTNEAVLLDGCTILLAEIIERLEKKDEVAQP